jgi:hypothetical protein
MSKQYNYLEGAAKQSNDEAIVQNQEYKDYRIKYDPPPVPGINYVYYHDDYDGPGDNRFGYCRTIQECKDEIDELIEEEKQ